MFSQFLINGLITGSLYALIALGFYLVYTPTKVFHIAYSAIYMIGPYFYLTFNSLGLPFGISILLSIILTGLVSLLVEVSIYRPLDKKKASSNIVLISSIGVMIIIINLIAMFYGNETKIINPEISDSINFGNIIITYNQIIQFLISFAILILIIFFLNYTHFGITIKAMSDDAKYLEVFGKNIRSYRMVLFLLSGSIAAIGSLLISYDVGMDPYVGMPMLLNAMVALIIGGIYRPSAALIGGVSLGIIQSIVIYQYSAKWQDASTFVVLILILLIKYSNLKHKLSKLFRVSKRSNKVGSY